MKTRSAVSVREGQGVVLLCGPPPHHGGTWSSSESGAAQRMDLGCSVTTAAIALDKVEFWGRAVS